MPLQPWAHELLIRQVRKFPEGQYFPSKILPSKFFSLRTRLQVSLVRKVSLILWISRKYNPPCYFSRIIFDQAIHAILWLPVRLSHQNLVKDAWILFHSDNRSWKHVIAKDGIVVSTLFRIVVSTLWLDPVDKRGEKIVFFLPKSSGRPGYLPVPPSCWIDRASL